MAKKRIVIVTATQEELEEAINGGCLNCGEIQYGGVEPDAEKYECEACGEHEVYGLEQLCLIGRLRVKADE
jgi:hypothetical protein